MGDMRQSFFKVCMEIAAMVVNYLIVLFCVRRMLDGPTLLHILNNSGRFTNIFNKPTTNHQCSRSSFLLYRCTAQCRYEKNRTKRKNDSSSNASQPFGSTIIHSFIHSFIHSLMYSFVLLNISLPDEAIFHMLTNKK